MDNTKTESKNTETFGEGSSSNAYSTRSELNTLAEKQKSDQNILLFLMAGVVLFVVVAFLVELFAMHRNCFQDKTILLQMNQQESKYFDKILFLNNEVTDLKTQLEILKAKNSYLK